jgi:hypothetical protein
MLGRIEECDESGAAMHASFKDHVAVFRGLKAANQGMQFVVRHLSNDLDARKNAKEVALYTVVKINNSIMEELGYIVRTRMGSRFEMLLEPSGKDLCGVINCCMTAVTWLGGGRG